MAFYEDALRQQVYHALLHASEQVSASAYKTDRVRNKNRLLKQFNPPEEAKRWTHLAGGLHKLSDSEVEGLMAEVSTSINLERRFTPEKARSL